MNSQDEVGAAADVLIRARYERQPQEFKAARAKAAEALLAIVHSALVSAQYPVGETNADGWTYRIDLGVMNANVVLLRSDENGVHLAWLTREGVHERPQLGLEYDPVRKSWYSPMRSEGTSTAASIAAVIAQELYASRAVPAPHHGMNDAPGAGPDA